MQPDLHHGLLWSDVFEAPVARFEHERRRQGPYDPRGGKHEEYGARRTSDAAIPLGEGAKEERARKLPEVAGSNQLSDLDGGDTPQRDEHG